MNDGREAAPRARVNYERGMLGEGDVAAEPFAQFAAWLGDAFAADDVSEPNAMTLATADAAGKPSARVVLLRGHDERGLTFFTNYRSRKALELFQRPSAALVFFWEPLQRQVRIEGEVARISDGESDVYFQGRPRGHRLSAWASPQSEIVESRAALERAMVEVETRFAGRDIERPPFWGGFRLAPERFEFWQGRVNRAHDRIAYVKQPEGWRIVRLAP